MEGKDKKIGVFVHIYYSESFDFIKEKLNVLKDLNATFFFNICSDTVDKETLFFNLKTHFSNCFIIETPNIGKDIGGKLACIDLYLKLCLNLSYIIFLHDKKSPHSSMGNTWREKLFRIVEPQNVNNILQLFQTDKKLGIVAAKEFIMNEYNAKTGEFEISSNEILKELLIQYDLKLATFDFIGGTMFWIKAEIIASFFSSHSPLAIRATLEHGNVQDYKNGTQTHAWERFLSWIAIHQNYLIKGI